MTEKHSGFEMQRHLHLDFERKMHSPMGLLKQKDLSKTMDFGRHWLMLMDSCLMRQKRTDFDSLKGM